jgi:hypothetical protein
MKARSWIAILSLVSCAIAAVGIACSSSDDTDGRSSCSCATGVCKTGTSCSDGFACVSDSIGTGTDVPTCRPLCPDGKTGCALDEHCDKDNVCHTGASKPVVVFEEQPRPCGAFRECPFQAKVLGGSGQTDHFDWQFDDDAGVVSIPDASITHRYGPGSHTTNVTAFDKNGTSSVKASTTDDICVDGVSISCSEGIRECCSGACTPEGGCR